MSNLGDRCKQFEDAEAGRRAMRGLPLLARLDGRAFHTFTRDLRRPYDEAMSRCMIETARHLVQDLNAAVAYTQSDEITVAWHASEPRAEQGREPSASPTEYPFDGRFQKLASVLAGTASTRFYQLVLEHLPAKAREVPHFDCRVWQVPAREDAADVFVWREDDATKNSVTMAALAHYTDRELHGKDTSVKQEMLFARGVNWNDFPAFFKRGTYLQRRSAERTLTEDERLRIPEPHRPAADAKFVRAQVVDLELPPARKVANLVDVLFERAVPVARDG
jgi:tRNA(His) 5'-end guanylyltransferase